MAVIGNPRATTPQTLRQRVLSRQTALETERSTFLSHWREIAQVISPRAARFMWSDAANPGRKKHNDIYDSHGLYAHRTLTAGLMAGATSPARPWHRVTTTDPELAEYASVKEWLFKLAQLERQIFNKSNTYRALPAIYKQLSGYGTAADILEPHFGSVVHHFVQSIGEYMLSADQYGAVDTICREFGMSVDQVVRKFGYENCSASVKTMWDTGGYDHVVPVIHLIQPRDLDKRDLRKRDNRNMPWMSVYIEAGSDNTSGVLRESGYKRFSVLAPRWETIGTDAYGSDCPGMTALGDILELQHDKRQRSKAVDYQADPPIQVPASMRNQENDFLPGGVSFNDAMGTSSVVRTAFDVKLDLSHLDSGIVDLRNLIDRAFFADLFLMMQGDQRSDITAREIAERHEEKLLMLGPVLENVHDELLAPLVDYTFLQIIEAGIMPPPPPELQGQELKVEFVSVLAQAQKAVGLNSVDRLIGTIGAISNGQAAAGKVPDAWDKLDTDQAIDKYADMLGVDPDLIVADENVVLVRQQRAQAQAQAATQQNAAVNSQTAKTLSETDNQKPSALRDVMQAFSGYGGVS